MKSIDLPLKSLRNVGYHSPYHWSESADSTLAYRTLYPLALLTVAFILAVCCPSQARAQGTSVTLHQGQLHQAGWHKTPLQIQILDERPRVKDLRTPEPAPDQYVMPIPPRPTSQRQANSVGSGVRM